MPPKPKKRRLPSGFMKTVRLLGSFLADAPRVIGEGFLAFFRFTEEDANILLSAHGFRAAEIERLDKSVSDEKGKNLKVSEEFAEEARHAESSSPGDIERPFPRPWPHLHIIRMTATIAAAAA